MSKLRLFLAAVALAFAVGSMVSLANPTAWADSHTNCIKADGTPC